MAKTIRYGIISDTHGLLPASVYHVFEGVKRIYHCGDIGSTTCLAELETIAPLRAVAGNMDSAVPVTFPDQIVEELEFGTLAMVHGTQYGHRNETIIHGLLHQFAETPPRLIIFGHSHVPCLEEHAGILFLNPGSPSRPKIGTTPTVALVEYTPGIDDLVIRHMTVV